MSTVTILKDNQLRAMSTKRLVTYLRSLRARESALENKVYEEDQFKTPDAGTVLLRHNVLITLHLYISRIKAVLATRENITANA